MTPLLRSDPIGGSELDPGCSDTVTPQLGIGCQVRGHSLFFFFSRINFKLVHSSNVKHLTCIIFCSSGLQNIYIYIYKLHIWKCSTFTIFTLFTKFHIQNRPKGLLVGTY